MLLVVQMGVGCLMHLGHEAWELLQGMVDSAPSPKHARRALLMGLQASALKVGNLCPPAMPLAVALLHALSCTTIAVDHYTQITRATFRDW